MKMTVCLAVCMGFQMCGIAVSAEEPGVPALNMAKQYVKAAQELGRKQSAQPVDSEKLNASYRAVLPVIKCVDAWYGLSYEKDIRQALDKCVAGERVDVNEQIIGKGLQHITVQAIRREMDALSAAEQPAVAESAMRISVYFEHIRPTFIRRDAGFFGGKKTLERSADDAVATLSKTAQADRLVACRQLEDAVARTMALSILFEAGELVKARDTDAAFCDVKRAEANGYYRSIEARVEKRSPRANELITTMLNGSYGAVDVQELERALTIGLSIPLR